MYMYQFPQQEGNTQPCTIAAPNLQRVFAEPGFELLSHVQLYGQCLQTLHLLLPAPEVLVTFIYL